MQKLPLSLHRFRSVPPVLFYIWAAFLLPVTLFLGSCALNGIYPFGGRTLMLSDMYNQYTAFFSYLQRMLPEGNDFFYSFSLGMGGSMLSLAATYLTSPVNLFVFLVAPGALPVVVTWMLATKIGLCGVTAYVLLRGMDKRDAGGPMALVFSTGYALIGYVVHYMTNIMWMDGVILLPLVALGMLHMVRRRRIGLYVAALAAALFTNYYIGYMICLFSVPFFAVLCFTNMPDEGRGAWLWPRALSFAGASLAAGGAAGFMLLPTLYALFQTSKANLSPHAFAFTEMFPLSELPNMLRTGWGTFEGAEHALPKVFGGALTAVMAVLFFANRRIRLREKVLSGALLALLLASFHVQVLDVAWHAFNVPIAYPYRYSFVFSFVMLWLAWRCFTHADGIVAKHALLLMPVCALWCLFATAPPLGQRYLDALLLCICLALLWA
ncbi:MAG: YfhO family protein, partial [Clostridia bacterium]|nr:YfhO family protein [Clostridia bacterium]